MQSSSFSEIRTPDGNAIKFKMPWDKGNSSAWFRTRLTTELLTAKSKARLPILGTWNAGPQKLILVDYDAKTPEQLALAHDLCQWAATTYPNCIGFTSASGNPRVGFLVELPEGRQLSAVDAIEYLRSKMPEQGWWFDHAGLERLYVNASNAAHLATHLPNLPVERILEPRATTLNAETGETRRVHTLYRAAHGDTPKRLEMWAKDTLRREFLRILTACWGLARDAGYNVSMQQVADNIGCSAAQVSRMLKELMNLGVLSCIDASWQMGRKARTYRAAGCLLGAIQTHKAAHSLRSSARAERLASPVCTTELRDGEAYRTLLHGLRHHQTRASYLAWVQSLPGATPQRVRDATRYYSYAEARKVAA